ncbi:MAG: hypothetical protein IPJ19_08300 [Planctomycetes bacterium]|nr:hypothetical protein [Planctomycetota bacterium]
MSSALRSLLALATTAPLLAAQGGYTTERFPDLGLSFPRARTYEAIPTQPNEEQIVLDFGEKVPDDTKKRKRVRPEMCIVWIERAPKRAARTGEGDPPPSGGGDDAPEAKPEAKPDPKAPKPIDSIESFVEQRLRGYKLGDAKPGKDREGCKVREFELEPPKNGPATWICAYENEQRTIAVLGQCDEKDMGEEQKIWRHTAEHFDIGEPEGKNRAKVEQIYARKSLSGVEHRVDVRLALVRGWKVEDTLNYIVLYDTPDQPLVRKIIRDLELLRKEYEQLFPSETPVTSVSAVRICKSRDEYLSYGGPPQSAGYWNYEDEELVLYDAETQDKAHHISDANTFIALYHEAFHQYIHYSTGELPPHSWFNEGHGDFFSGATIKDGKVRSIGPNPWRVRTIQNAIKTGNHVPLRELVTYEQPQYYANPYVCYAEGWSLIYFLRKSEVVAKRPEWAQLLPTYFAELKSGYAAELAKLEEQGKSKDKEARAKAGLAVRQAALARATQGVDLDELETAWKTFVAAIQEPKRE